MYINMLYIYIYIHTFMQIVINDNGFSEQVEIVWETFI
jgi:hypothetical protein